MHIKIENVIRQFAKAFAKSSLLIILGLRSA